VKPINGRWTARADELTGPAALFSEGFGSNSSKLEVSVSLVISGMYGAGAKHTHTHT